MRFLGKGDRSLPINRQSRGKTLHTEHFCDTDFDCATYLPYTGSLFHCLILIGDFLQSFNQTHVFIFSTYVSFFLHTHHFFTYVSYVKQEIYIFIKVRIDYSERAETGFDKIDTHRLTGVSTSTPPKIPKIPKIHQIHQCPDI